MQANDSKNKINISIIGAGEYVTKAHIPTYKLSRFSNYIDNVSIFNRTPSKAFKIARKYNLTKAYKSFQEVLDDKDIDMVSIVTSDHSHFEFALQALKANKHVFVEKPIALEDNQVRKLFDIAKSKKLLLGADFHKRWDPFHVDAKNRFYSTVGNLQMGYVWMQDTIFVPTGYISKETAENSSPIWFLGTHMFDLVSWITDLKPIQVKTVAYKQVLYAKNIDTYDTCNVEVLYENGACVNFYLGWILPNKFPSIVRQGLYFQGSRGSLEINSQDRGSFATTDKGYNSLNPLFISLNNNNEYLGYGIDSIGSFVEQVHKLKYGTNFKKASEYVGTYSNLSISTKVAEAASKSIRVEQTKLFPGVHIGKTVLLKGN